jgi:pre-mRNA-splicing helicase BRR2
LRVGERIILEVTLRQTVPGAERCQAYPMKKSVCWMLAIITKDTDILALTFVTVAKTLAVRLEFSLPEGWHQPRLWVECDSYMGLSQWIRLDEIVVRS